MLSYLVLGGCGRPRAARARGDGGGARPRAGGAAAAARGGVVVVVVGGVGTAAGVAMSWCVGSYALALVFSFIKNRAERGTNRCGAVYFRFYLVDDIFFPKYGA